MLTPDERCLHVNAIVNWRSASSSNNSEISREDRCDRTNDGLVYRKDRS